MSSDKALVFKSKIESKLDKILQEDIKKMLEEYSVLGSIGISIEVKIEFSKTQGLSTETQEDIVVFKERRADCHDDGDGPICSW